MSEHSSGNHSDTTWIVSKRKPDIWKAHLNLLHQAIVRKYHVKQLTGSCVQYSLTNRPSLKKMKKPLLENFPGRWGKGRDAHISTSVSWSYFLFKEQQIQTHSW